MIKKIVCFLLLFLVYVISLKATYIVSLKPLAVNACDKCSCKAVVVLGARDDYDRILKGLEISQENDNALLLLSGVHGKYKEVVQRFGLANVVFEDTSRTTYENAKNAKKLLERYDGICLVSSQAHLFRAKKVFEKFGMTTYPIVSNKNNLEMKMHHFLPDLKYFVLNISVLYEYLAIIQYKLQKRI